MSKKKDKRKFMRQIASRGFADQHVWSIDLWFIDVMPKMLQQLKETQHGVPVLSDDEGNILDFDDAKKKWEGILDRMIFLLYEMNVETCSQKNPYESDFEKVYEDFAVKYDNGNALKTAEEIEKEKNSHIRYGHTPSEIPEYRETIEKYLEKEREINSYMDDCKNEFFELFSQYFWNLWD